MHTSSYIRLIFLILVTGSAFVGSFYMRSAQAYWLIWTALFLALMSEGCSFKQRIIITVITGLTCALAALGAGLLSAFIFPLAIFVTLLIAFGFYYHQLDQKYGYCCLLISIYGIVSAGLACSWVESINRFWFIAIGLLLVIFVQFILSRNFYLRERNSWLTIALSHLQDLSDEIFNCFLQQDYPQNIYLYEKRIHVQKIKFLQSIQALRKLEHQEFKKGKEKKLSQLISEINLLYAVQLDCSQIRWRVSDHTLFALCAPELRLIGQLFQQVFFELILLVDGRSKKELPMQPLENAIVSLEEIYQNVLQVSAREPLVFLLFINGLKAYKNNLQLTAEAI